MSKDTIYREDAIKVLAINAPFMSDEAYLKSYDALKSIPSADRPQGEWIYVTVEEWLRTGRDYGHHCSECDEVNKDGGSNFCPNCGARMKGADDELLRQL